MTRQAVLLVCISCAALVLVVADGYWDDPKLAAELMIPSDPSVPCGVAPSEGPAQPGAPEEGEERIEIRPDARPRPRPFYPNRLVTQFGQSTGEAPSTLPVNEPGGPHAYFNRLTQRPGLVCAYSLRNHDQLMRWAHGDPSNLAKFPPPQYWIDFDPVNDPYHSPQDAAKVIVPANRASSKQVRLPLGFGDDGGAYLLTWDAWWGPEFFTHSGEMETQKTFQIAEGKPGEDRWIEIRSRYLFSRGLPDIAAIDGRKYSGITGNMTDDQPLAPMAGSFMIRAQTWVRYWALIQTSPVNTFTLWVADENREAVKIFDQLDIIFPSDGIAQFWLEYNSSQERTGPEMVGYARNVVLLRIADPSALPFERPLK